MNSARRKANSAENVMPTRRNGRLSSHMNGQATSARIANGQHSTNSRHHTPSANKVFITGSLGGTPPPVVTLAPCPSPGKRFATKPGWGR
ncbi:hypothetical protein D3C81_699830 [compost metagenome]